MLSDIRGIQLSIGDNVWVIHQHRGGSLSKTDGVVTNVGRVKVTISLTNGGKVSKLPNRIVIK